MQKKTDIGKWVCAGWLFFSTFACSEEQVYFDPTAQFDWGEVPEWTFSAEPILHFGIVEGDSHYQFFRISGLLTLNDGTVVVANSGTGQLRFFDAEGRFIRQVGGTGGGPGEFRWMSKIYPWENGGMMVLDRSNRKSYFDRYGTFVTSENIQPSLTNPFSMDWWMYRRAWVQGVVPGPQRLAAAGVLDNIPSPPGAPGYWVVRIDSEENLWLSERVQGQRGRVDWVIVNREARPIGRITLPGRFDMFQITGRDVLGVWRDEDDVEFVRLYAFQPHADSLGSPVPLPPPDEFVGDSTLILATARSDLRNMVIASEAFFANHIRYARSTEELEFQTSQGVSIELISSSPTGWMAGLVHVDSPVMCGIGLGSHTPPGWPEGSPICADLFVRR